MNWVTPRPSQSGQAPSGLLKENERGVSSATDQPQTEQAWRVEKTMSSASPASAAPSPAGLFALVPFSARRPPARRFLAGPAAPAARRSAFGGAVQRGDARRAFAERGGGLERLGQTEFDAGAHLEAIDDHVDVVLAPLVEHDLLVELAHLAVHARAQVTVGTEALEHLGVIALPAADQRREQGEGTALGLGHHAIDHLADGLRLERLAVTRADGNAGAGEQQPEVVVHLGDRADGRARVVGGGLLLDRDGRGKPVDQVDVRLLHHRQELPGIGRQRLHVAPLTLGEQRVEGERGLAAAGEPCDDDQAVAGQVRVDALEVVRARTADADEVHGEGPFGEGLIS